MCGAKRPNEFRGSENQNRLDLKLIDTNVILI